MTDRDIIAAVETVGGVLRSIAALSQANGHRSLNELIVLNLITLATLKRSYTNVTTIARDMGWPVSTTSKTVSRLAEQGWVEVDIDPDDPRRRILTVSERALERTEYWVETLP